MTAPRIRQLVAGSWSLALLQPEEELADAGWGAEILSNCLLAQLESKYGGSSTITRHFASLQRGNAATTGRLMPLAMLPE